MPREVAKQREEVADSFNQVKQPTQVTFTVITWFYIFEERFCSAIVFSTKIYSSLSTTTG